jgi:Kef-type K+ transport system membrane component KefB/nucleotide-binding universal stress UspA family protein
LSFLIHDPLTRFIAQVAAIILVSRLFGLVARRFGQPLVIAEVVAGIALGPSLLGWLWPEAGQAIFPASSLGVLQLVSQLGLVLFMFLVGLELDPALLRGRGRASVAISHSSIVVPFALGALLAFELSDRLSPPTVPFLAFALFMGAAMSITAFPVLARILAERKLMRTKIGAVTIACAAVDDVTAWCLLAFVVAAARASGIQGAVVTSLLALVYIAVMLLVVRPALGRVALRFANKEGLSQNVVAVTILLLLASAWATELIGIHALFGAFVFGAILPKDGGFARGLAEKLEDVVLVVLLPLFFAFSGVRTQIGLLSTPEAWWTCGLIILVACLGKFGGSFAAAKLTGLSWRESGAIGILMNTRGLMELIVLNIGLDLGVISPTLFTMMVLMALVTTFMTTPLLHLIYPPERLTSELLERAEPTPELAPAPGFTVLVCVAQDRSGPGLILLASAFSPGPSRLYALGMLPMTERGSAYIDSSPEQPADTLAPLMARAHELELEVKPLSFVSADPGRDICDVAQVKGADLVLLGWHRPLFAGSRLGGVVAEVMKEANSNVGVFVDRGLTQIKRVLVPFLGTPHDRSALALAQRMLAGASAEVTILHVVTPERAGDDALGARNAMETVFDERDGRVTFRSLQHPSPPEAVLAESQRGYDLVIVGIGREWGIEQRSFGIQTERLLRESPASILVVHGAASAPEAAAAEWVPSPSKAVTDS